MKRIAGLLLMLMLLAVIPAAQAQTAISQNAANDYYKKCMANDDERMSDETQKSLCSCTAAKMMAVVTEEDLERISSIPGPGREPFDRMLADAYGPCMQIPIEEKLHDECMQDGKIKQFALRDQSALCRCVAVRTTARIPVDAPVLMRAALKKDPTLVDAFDTLAYSEELRNNAYQNIFVCLKEGN